MAFKNRYSISGDFPAQKVNSDALTATIKASEIADELSYINIGHADIPEDDGSDNCDIYTVDELDPTQKSVLDGIVAAHPGNPPITFDYKAPSNILIGSKPVTEDASWEDISGTIGHLTAFVSDQTKAWGRVTGQIKTSGITAQLQLIRESDGLSCMVAPKDLPDTGGEWSIISFWANTNQPADPDRFVLQGRLNGATSLQTRDFAISILERIT